MDEFVGKVIKGYEFKELIGQGGFGVIYKAYQSILKREVAVKVIASEFANDPDFIRRFDVEAELVAQLEHPYIVPLYDYWRSPEGAYLVMRLLSAGSLRNRLDSGSMPLELAVETITSVADALHIAHRRNIIHRDVKPENILLDEDNHAYLTDFGIATLLGSDDANDSDTFSGSLLYAPLEQVLGEHVTQKVDIYALGVVLYEVLVGSPPFKSSTIGELVQAKMNNPIPSVQETNPDLPFEFDDIISKATAKAIEDRYDNILDFKKALQRALNPSAQLATMSLMGAETQNLSSIFISYVRSDEAFANRLAQDLQSAGHRCWLDLSDIRSGDEWIQSITSGIENAYAFISIVSEAANTSRWVQREFLQAEEEGKPIFPIWAQETRLPIYMKDRQVIALHTDYDAGLQALLAQLPAPRISNFVATEEAVVELINPYKGLRAFQEYDSSDFYGREVLIQQLLDRLGEDTALNRFLAVIGPSGSGKSSVVKAGLLPALRRGGLGESQDWFYIEMVPGTQPFEELEAALLHVAVEPIPGLMDILKSDARGLVRAVKQVLPRNSESELLIIIDQFEEVFTLSDNEEMRKLFLDSLNEAVTDQRSRIRIVVTLRADFYDKPLMYSGIGNMLRQRTEVVLPLTEEELERTIVAPAENAGAVFDPGLVTAIINDVSRQPGMLPLLQYALTELFEKRTNRILSLKTYQEIGGVSGALARRAEDIYSENDSNFQAAVRQLFLRLVTLGEGTEDTRRRIRRSEVTSIENVERAIDVFGKYRLLTLDRDSSTHEPTVEVAHEALIREWERVREWLSTAREEVRTQRSLTHAVIEWEENDRSVDFLARDTRLIQFEEWAKQSSLKLNELEQSFLNSSIAERAERERLDYERKAREEEIARRAAQYETTAKQFRRASYVLGFMVVVALISVSAAVFYTTTQLQQAEEYASFINYSRERAATQVAGLGALPANANAEAVDSANVLATATTIANLHSWLPIEQAFDSVAMVQVPSGCFVMGTAIGNFNEAPVHEVCFDTSFWIDKYEVTNAQFEAFAGVSTNPAAWDDPQQPRTNVSWGEAFAFCQQRGARLLTEAEWEYAARGIDSLIYPWGNAISDENNLLSWKAPAPANVGSFAAGASWVGALDMSGNVWEWVNSMDEPYPYRADDGRENVRAGINRRVLRGGAYSSRNPDSVRATRRFAADSEIHVQFVGFRCALDNA